MLTSHSLTIIVLIVVVCLIAYIMANISTLANRLRDLQSKVDVVSLNVQSLRDQIANSGEIPAEAEALLFNLNATLDALAANSVVPSNSTPSGPLP